MAGGFQSFRTRLTVSVIALALIPLLLFGGIVTLEFRSTLTEQVNGSLTSDAEAIQHLLEDSFSDNRKNVESWSEEAIVRGALMYSAFDKCDAELEVLQRRYPEFLAIVLLTPDGQPMSANSPVVKQQFASQQAAVAKAPWFRAALQRQVNTAGVESLDPILGKQVLYFGAPVLSPVDGSIMGVLVAAYDFQGRTSAAVRAPVVRAAQRGYSSFQLLVARADGTIAFDSNASRGGIPLPKPEVALLIGKAAASHLSQNGDKVAVVMPGSSEMGWHYLAVLDRTDAYAPARRSVWLAVALAVTFGACAAALSLLLARRLVRPINALNIAVDRIVREGDLTRAIEVQSTDEIGQLAATFQKMVVKLREIPLSLDESTRL